jgi:hypothetical protein
MNSTPHSIRQFVPCRDYDAALATLLHAFCSLEFCCWILPDAAQRERELTRAFSQDLLKPDSDVLIEVTDDVSAVAIWERPRMPISATRQKISASFTSHDRAIRRFFAAADAASPDRTTHWYLANLASRGGGGGAALLRHRASLLAEVGAHFCLFTGSERNVSYYQHLGLLCLTSVTVDCEAQTDAPHFCSAVATDAVPSGWRRGWWFTDPPT